MTDKGQIDSLTDLPALGESVLTDLGTGVVVDIDAEHFIVRHDVPTDAGRHQVVYELAAYGAPTTAERFVRAQWGCNYGNDSIACMLRKHHLGSHVFKVKKDARLRFR